MDSKEAKSRFKKKSPWKREEAGSSTFSSVSPKAGNNSRNKKLFLIPKYLSAGLIPRLIPSAYSQGLFPGLFLGLIPRAYSQGLFPVLIPSRYSKDYSWCYSQCLFSVLNRSVYSQCLIAVSICRAYSQCLFPMQIN